MRFRNSLCLITSPQHIVKIALLILISSLTLTSYSQESTPGEMTFSVRTVTYYGDRSPKHVLVIWVEDSNGFVKTRELNGDRRKEWLLTWRASSNYNVVDATTGATLNSHTSHSVKWDCKDLEGNLVPDGEYTVYIEFTEEHAQGPLFSVKFTKGPETLTLNPSDQDYFKDMTLAYEPLTVTSGFDYSIDGMDVAFNNTSTGADSYFWDFGDGKTTAQTNPTHTYSAAGTYTVSLKASTGSLSDTHTEDIVISEPGITAGFSYVADGLSVTFTNASVNADTYTWDFGDGNSSSDENPVHAYNTDGTYTVILEAAKGSTSATTQQDVTVTDPTVGIVPFRDGISVHPNPTSQGVIIDPAEGMAIQSIKLLSLDGRIIMNWTKLNTGTVEIDLSNFKTGIYILQLESNGQTSHQFILKE